MKLSVRSRSPGAVKLKSELGSSAWNRPRAEACIRRVGRDRFEVEPVHMLRRLPQDLLEFLTDLLTG